jgi:hypothetical protein
MGASLYWFTAQKRRLWQRGVVVIDRRKPRWTVSGYLENESARDGTVVTISHFIVAIENHN